MLSNLKIGARLTLLVSTLCLLLLVVGVIGLVGQADTKERLRSVYEDRTVTLEELSDVIQGSYRSRERITAALYEDNVAESIRGLDKIGGYTEAMQKAWKAYRSKPLEPGEKVLADQVDAAMAILAAARVQVVDVLRTQGRAVAFETFKRVDFDNKVNAFREPMGKLINMQVTQAEAEYRASTEDFGRARAGAIGAIVVGLVFGGCMAWFTIRSITTPLNDAVRLAARVAQGDLSSTIVVKGRDETALLMQSMSDMQKSLHKLITDINSGVGQLSNATAELSSAAVQVSQASDNQSEAASSMAASVEQMTVSISHISDRAADTQTVSSETGRLSREGAAVVHRSADEMEQIAQSVNQSADVVRRLGEKSKEIAHIVSVIKDIADQTNLLALNAAIEAARAGEQGRGFAVVADEVRKLSEKTAGSTNEIAAMVDAIAMGTQEAVGSMESGVARVDAGVALARQAGESITQIEGASAKLLDAVNDISSALKEQSQASNDIAKHVEKIAQMSEENSVAIKETAQASHSLESLASLLHTSVSRFKI